MISRKNQAGSHDRTATASICRLGVERISSFHSYSTETTTATSTACCISPMSSLPIQEGSSLVIVKQVQFHQRARIRTTLSIDEMTDKELESVWYSPNEYKQFSRREKFLLKRIKNAQTETETGLIVSKYGPLDSEDTRIRRTVRTKKGFYYVLREQDKQWKQEIQDSDRLAHASRRVSSICEMDAITKAKNLAKEILLLSSSLDSCHEQMIEGDSKPVKRREKQSRCMSPVPFSSDNFTSSLKAIQSPCQDRWQSSSTAQLGGDAVQRMIQLPLRR